MIYFDNSATTPIYPQALDTYVKPVSGLLAIRLVCMT